LLTVRKIALSIRKWNIGEGEDRTQYIGFSKSIEEVWEGQGSVRGPVLEKEGGLGEGIIGKTTVLTPRNNVDSRSEGYAVSVGSEFSDPSGIIVSHKSHLTGNRVCSLASRTTPLTQSPFTGVLG
jgi:hypothetical protein